MALERTGTRHACDPTALADEEATKVTGEARAFRYGVIHIFDQAPVIHEMKQRPVFVFAGKGRELTGSRMNDFNRAALFVTQSPLNNVRSMGKKPCGRGHTERAVEGPG